MRHESCGFIASGESRRHCSFRRRSPAATTTPAAKQPLAGPSVPAVTSGTAQLATSAGGAQPSSEPVPVGADDPVWGSATAPVTLVEFSELQCPFCARVHPTIKSLQAKYGPNQLRVVFKHNPASLPRKRAARRQSGRCGAASGRLGCVLRVLGSRVRGTAEARRRGTQGVGGARRARPGGRAAAR